jgi:hypothetical protein
MNQNIKLLIVLIFSLLFLNCDLPDIKEESSPNIIYPDQGTYGDNLLRDSNINIDTSQFYSLCAATSNEATVKVIFPICNNPFDWIWYLIPCSKENGGWHEGPGSGGYYGDCRIFIADGDGNHDLKIQFNHHNSATIEIYENDSIAPIRTKTLTW